jgi:pyruvate kinase
MDLHGPRIRVGQLTEPRELVQGESVTFAPEAVATAAELPTTYADLAKDMRRGSKILLDDGLLAVEVTGVRGDRVDGVVRYGGLLRANKDEPPGVDVSAPAVTDKDREDVQHAVELGCGPSASRSSAGPRSSDSSDPDPKRVQLVAKIEGHRPPPSRSPSSTPPTPSWWPAATSASSCPSRRCRWSRSA